MSLFMGIVINLLIFFRYLDLFPEFPNIKIYFDYLFYFHITVIKSFIFLDYINPVNFYIFLKQLNLQLCNHLTFSET
jgi:hypothetical protein